MISEVATRYEIHPQTLRLYEREGLLAPPRSDGNTRLYDEASLARLEVILTLTRDMGVNLAGVEVILSLRDRIEELQAEREGLVQLLRQQSQDRRNESGRKHALVKVQSGPLARLKR
jgi:MerR family transcriptional regulator/heat shock protein HspR